jgi:hypothetical protein
MSASTASVIAVAVLLVTGLALEFAARRGHDRATAAQALGAAMRTTPGRAIVLAAWVWLGVHFLAR